MPRLLLPVLLAGVLLAAGCGGDGSAAAPGAGGSTVEGRYVDPDGDGALTRGPGEPLRPRTALGPQAEAGATLATLVQVTDAHVRDEESPARTTFLDRLGGALSPTFRPQEALSTQVLAAALGSARALRPDALVVTGDVVDNAEASELRMALEVLRGGRVDPDTGGRGYEGPQEASNPDPTYYRPDVDPPSHPGLLDAAQRPFTSPGHGDARLLLIPGNHDVLAQGEATPTADTDAIAVGDRILTRPDEDIDVSRQDAEQANELLERLIAGGQLPGETERVTPDGSRRFLAAGEVRAQLNAASQHAELPAGDRGPGSAVIQDLGARVRVVTLDFDQAGEGRGGTVTPADEAFLAQALATAGERWVILATHQPLSRATGGERLLAQLDADPYVLATIAGDTHRHRIDARETATGGYWELQTSSLTDFPQQARALRVRETAGGGAVLETWALDTAPGELADTARELAFLDAQGGRPTGRAGRPADRNASLYRAAPR